MAGIYPTSGRNSEQRFQNRFMHTYVLHATGTGLPLPNAAEADTKLYCYQLVNWTSSMPILDPKYVNSDKTVI